MESLLEKSELLAPAGSFSSAVYAFKNGADAVYLGLQSFSARKGAKNFSFDQLRALKSLAVEESRKIYITFNTIILQKEMDAVYSDLYNLSLTGIDGIIIQDHGLLNLLQSSFPEIPVHASTQMGIHNSAGVKELIRQGVRRIILSRELSLEEITSLTMEFKDIEFEVFIHGLVLRLFRSLSCLRNNAGPIGKQGRMRADLPIMVYR